jgi:putative SOS response-associated peptidase YedK
MQNRMPVILKPGTWPVWLGEEPADACVLKGILEPCPTGKMTRRLVSQRVGNFKNYYPSLIELVPAAAGR